MLTLIIGGKHYEVTKSSLKSEMKTAQNNQLDKKVIDLFNDNQNSIDLPSWVQKQQFQVIYQYLILVDNIKQLEQQKKQTKISQFLTKFIVSNTKLNHTKKLINIIRVSDYLTLEQFQQYFIQKCVIEQLNNENCILYLQETHKKLKNSSSGTAQAWYNLLNACIDYISYNLSQIYLKEPQRMQKLHQKILGEILDRTIKYQILSTNKKNNKKNNIDEQKQKQIVFNLLMKSKKSTSVDSLCNSLKQNLLNKKINKKMHAKLSWKLHDLNLITERKVKNFKFLDLNWILEAVRTPTKRLQIKLTLLPLQAQNANYTNNYSIGIFYSKLYWNFQRYIDTTSNNSQVSSTRPTLNDEQQQIPPNIKTQDQKPLQIHYICMKNPKPIHIFEIDGQFQQILNGRKLELSIFCSIDHCYSFVMNYVINDYNRVRLDEKKISKEEIYSIIEGSKVVGKYSQAVWLIKYLAKNQMEIPIELLERIPFDKLPTYETQFLKKLIRNDNNILDEVFGKKQLSSKSIQLENQINSISRNQINSRVQINSKQQITSLSNSKVSQNMQTKSNHSRAPSRGGHRKIFGQSPQKDLKPNIARQSPKHTSQTYINMTSNTSIQHPIPSSHKKSQFELQKQQHLKNILQITNMKNYFYDQNSQLISMI